MSEYSRRQAVFLVLVAAQIMCWPAVMNHYPLLYADSLSYLNDGQDVAGQFLHHTGTFVGMRSELYALGIYLVHWQRSPWPVVALQALIVAYVLYVVVRAFFAERLASRYLLLVLGLSALTAASWYVSLIMPDILGGPLYIATCLLVFCPQTLTKFDRIALPVIAWFCIVSHATHVLMAAFVLVLLAALLLFRSRIMQGRAHRLGLVVAIFAVAVTSQLALHKYLYGLATMDGNRLPYLSARFISDGPEREYLHSHCASEHWALCASLDTLPSNDDEFLWGEDTMWMHATAAEKEQILHEEMPLLVRTLRTYPRQQLAISLGAFWRQLSDFGVNDFDNNTWMQDHMEETMPHARVGYDRSLQAHDRVPSEFFTQLQKWPVYAALIVLAALLPWMLRCRKWVLLGFCIVIVAVLLANAFVAATISEVDSRYQARIIWLLPLMAAMALMLWKDSRTETNA